MTDRCEVAAVIGAGIMGTGIAAHFAGAGIKTFLLDIVPPNLPEDQKNNPKFRSQIAQQAIQKALKANPAVFYDAEAARLVTPGNIEDHLDWLRECDLVVEAVIERMDIKKSLFQKLAMHTKDSAILASNTSGLSIAQIAQELPDEVQKRLLVMHFFNPVRYMRLLEIVTQPKTDPNILARAVGIGERLGKGIVYGKDTPNFVANRIGMYAMMQAIKTMAAEGYSIEEVDKIVGTPMGRPRSAAFRTADLVGIDTVVHVAQNCYDALPNDEERDVFQVPDWIEKLVASKRLGQKSGAGFYKKQGKEILVLDVGSLEYRPQNKIRYDSLGAAKKTSDLKKRLKNLVAASDRAGQFAWQVLAKTLCYTAKRVGEISDDIVNIDRAMRWGFNWELGPFETWDAIGVTESVARMKKDGLVVPEWVDSMLKSGQDSFYQGPLQQTKYFDVAKQATVHLAKDPKQISLAALHEDKSKILKENMGAALVDLGDGCLCVEVHTKMNTVDDDVVKMLHIGVEEVEKNFEALVIGNDGEHFGAGANLMLIMMAAKQKQWDQIDASVKAFQDVLQKIRFASIPVVVAPFQYAFGGAAEICLAGDACQAHAETYIGLVEVGAGLLPAGGGCLRMMDHWTLDASHVANVDLLPFVGEAFKNIGMANVAKGAHEGVQLRYLKTTDGISLNRDHLLYSAKQRALGMARVGYQPPRSQVYKAAGYDAAKTIAVQVWGMVEGGFASEHDFLIAKKVACVLCGGKVAAGTERSEQDYLELEREAFLSLCGEEKSQARMQSLLMTNKPLRN